MIRIIIRADDFTHARHVEGAGTVTRLKTFDVEAPQVEQFMRDVGQYEARYFVGAEVVEGVFTASAKPQAATPQAARYLHEDDVRWVVNSHGELGVKIGEQCFFLYKGESLQYDDEATSLQVRPVGKREFGECCRSSETAKYDARGGWSDMAPAPRGTTRRDIPAQANEGGE